MTELSQKPITTRWIVPTTCWAYVFLLIGGYAIFRSRLAMPVDSVTIMSQKAATFFVANAASLTGFQTSVTIESLRPMGQVAVFVLMIAGAALSWIVGGTLVARALRLPIGEKQIAAISLALLLVATLLGALSAPAGELFASIFRAVSAITNSGLWIGNRPSSAAATTVFCLVPLAVVGGVGVTILAELWRYPIARTISLHARSTLLWLATVYLVGGAALLCSNWMSRGFPAVPASAEASSIDPTSSRSPTMHVDWQTPMADASVRALNTRSAGLPTEMLNTLDRPTQWIAAGLMLIGAGSGGAAGGLKVTTLAILVAGIGSVFRGDRPTRVFGIAAVWLGSYMLVVMLTFWWLLGVAPEQSADRLLMLSISAVGNVGLSHDVISASGYDAYVLSVAMIAGRILPLAVLAWVAGGEEAEVVVG